MAVIQVFECIESLLECRLQELEDEGSEIISVTWRSVPYSKYAVIYRLPEVKPPMPKTAPPINEELMTPAHKPKSRQSGFSFIDWLCNKIKR